MNDEQYVVFTFSPNYNVMHLRCKFKDFSAAIHSDLLVCRANTPSIYRKLIW